MAPAWGLLPLVLLATAATIIASQAVISGAFSLTQQAVQLGLLPRLEIQHTSASLVGQIYMPRVNWTLLAAVLILVLLFRSSSALASAYGIAVTGTMVVTSLLAFTVFRRAWGWPLPAVAGGAGAAARDRAHLPRRQPRQAARRRLCAADHCRQSSGSLMTTWVRGTRIVNAKARAASVSTATLLGMLRKSRPARAPGTAVFLTSDPDVAPRRR